MLVSTGVNAGAAKRRWRAAAPCRGSSSRRRRSGGAAASGSRRRSRACVARSAPSSESEKTWLISGARSTATRVSTVMATKATVTITEAESSSGSVLGMDEQRDQRRGQHPTDHQLVEDVRRGVRQVVDVGDAGETERRGERGDPHQAGDSDSAVPTAGAALADSRLRPPPVGSSARLRRRGPGRRPLRVVRAMPCSSSRPPSARRSLSVSRGVGRGVVWPAEQVSSTAWRSASMSPTIESTSWPSTDSASASVCVDRQLDGSGDGLVDPGVHQPQAVVGVADRAVQALRGRELGLNRGDGLRERSVRGARGSPPVRRGCVRRRSGCRPR